MPLRRMSRSGRRAPGEIPRVGEPNAELQGAGADVWNEIRQRAGCVRRPTRLTAPMPDEDHQLGLPKDSDVVTRTASMRSRSYAKRGIPWDL